jgi:hypothetical protein
MKQSLEKKISMQVMTTPPLWFYAIDDVLENAAPPGFACRVFDVELNSTSRNESGLFCEADKDTAWRDAMQDEIKMIEDNDT